MIRTKGYAAKSSKSSLAPFSFYRREPGPHDVLIKTLYCGICHSDIHQARNEWKSSRYPMVPGHEIVGRVARVGSKVKRFKVGESVGVGCFVDSCRKCPSCREGFEQYCEGHISFTYNGTEQDQKTRTQGGYSSHIVADEKYVLKVSEKLPLAAAAPLLCAGVTTYSPMKYFNVRKGQRVGIAGLGGLGHMGVKFARAMGADVTVFSTSRAKEKDARRLGASHFVMTKNLKNKKALENRFDFILDAISAPHDINFYLDCLKREGVLVVVGVPDKAPRLEVFSLIMKRRKIAGSLIGGIKETQEMLDFCARKKITSDVEIIPAEKINNAYERTLKGDVRYRFVIDLATL